MNNNKLFLPYLLLLIVIILAMPFWTLLSPEYMFFSMMFLFCSPSADLLPQFLIWSTLTCRKLQDGFNPTTEVKLIRVASSRTFRLGFCTVGMVNMLCVVVFHEVDFSGNTEHWFPPIQLCKPMFEALNFTPNSPLFRFKWFLLNQPFRVLKWVATFDVVYITHWQGSNASRLRKAHLARGFWGVSFLLFPLAFLPLFSLLAPFILR